MTVDRLEEACQVFCRMAQVAPAPLTPDAHGMSAFHVDWRGVTASVVYAPEHSREHAAVLFEMGPIEGQRLDASSIMKGLLTTNFLPWRGTHAPVFALHPHSGDAILQCVYPILDERPESLYTLMEDGVSLVLNWREGFFVRD